MPASSWATTRLVTEPLNRIWYERNTGRECPTQCARCLFAFFGCMKFPEAHARPSPILVDEFDAKPLIPEFFG
jgi:hypothetical protein